MTTPLPVTRVPAPLRTELTRPWAPEPGARVLVAVSGGADSVALLHLLAALAPGRGWELRVATFDHGWRGEAGRADCRFVSELAAALGLPCREGAAGGNAGPRTEALAREARRRFLAEVAVECGAAAIALGHSLDDQAETVLFRLARGSGLAGTAAMARQAAPYWRPLLAVRRVTLRDLLARAGLAWREDSTNRALDAARNRIRQRALPALEEAAGASAAANLARAAELARDDEELLEALAAGETPGIVGSSADAVTIDRARLAALPPALARRVARRALRALDASQPCEASHLLAIVALAAASGPGTEIHLPRGVVARRRRGEVILTSLNPPRDPR